MVPNKNCAPSELEVERKNNKKRDIKVEREIDREED